MTAFEGEATTVVDAPPDAVYALVTDVTRTGEWSPECYRAEWLDGATGAQPGAKFKGWNKQGFMRWSTKPTVLTAELGKEFSFRTNETVWRYRFEADGGGTRLTESFEVEKYNALFKIIMPIKRRQAQMIEGMKATIARIKDAAEAKH